MSQRPGFIPLFAAEPMFARLSRRRVLAATGAALATTTLGAVTQNTGVAAAEIRQATPDGTPSDGELDQEIAGIVQFTHPEKVYFYVPGFEDEAVLASLYGLDVDTYRRIKDHFAAAARATAEELIADASFAARVDRLPFQPGQLVVAIGESDTDDLQSWLEIVRHLLDLRRPNDGIRVFNAGISGQLTTQAHNRFLPIIMQQPDWIVCALGANDANRNGPEPTLTLVSPDETARNLAELRRRAEAQTEARWIWMTRPPINEERMAAYPVFQQVMTVWRNADIDAVNDFMRQQPEPVVDIQVALGRPPAPELQMPDGLHPTLAGHRAMAKTFVEQLTA